jgi:hypothetical protein
MITTAGKRLSKSMVWEIALLAIILVKFAL